MVEHVVRLVKVCGDESMAMLVVVPWMGGFMQQHLHRASLPDTPSNKTYLAVSLLCMVMLVSDIQHQHALYQ